MENRMGFDYKKLGKDLESYDKRWGRYFFPLEKALQQGIEQIRYECPVFPRGCCVVTAKVLVNLLNAKYVHGVFKPDKKDSNAFHTWIEFPDGKRLDLTVHQFGDYTPGFIDDDFYKKHYMLLD